MILVCLSLVWVWFVLDGFDGLDSGLHFLGWVFWLVLVICGLVWLWVFRGLFDFRVCVFGFGFVMVWRLGFRIAEFGFVGWVWWFDFAVWFCWCIFEIWVVDWFVDWLFVFVDLVFSILCFLGFGLYGGFCGLFGGLVWNWRLGKICFGVVWLCFVT